MASTVSISVTKNADGSLDITSGDATANAWRFHADAADRIDDFSSIKNRVWAELLRQIKTSEALATGYSHSPVTKARLE